MKTRLHIAFFILLLLCAIALPAPGAAETEQQQQQQPPYKAVTDRLESLTVLPLNEWLYHDDIPHPEDPAINDAGWNTVKWDERWKGARVLRCHLQVPDRVNGYSTRGARLSLTTDFRSGKAMVISIFCNGSLAAHFTHQDMQEPIPLTESAQPGQTFLIAVRLDASPEVNSRIASSRLRIQAAADRPDPDIVRREILSLQAMVGAYPDAERKRSLDAAVGAIDTGALDRNDQEAFDQSLKKAQAGLETFRPWLRQFTIEAIGNAHIDMAWLWPWTETVEVVRDTFRSALDLMREYPDFRFTQSQAKAYEWMEEKYPDLFHEIQQRVKEGRWEIAGGMWVEPDLNMPGGESLVRQILLGKRYFREKFGVDVKIGWNPDSFGYNWQLPQIYKKAGIDYFVTQKLLWAKEFTVFPYKMFWWESPDGTRMLTYFPHDYGGNTNPESMAGDLSVWAPEIYGGQGGGTSVKDPAILYLYGVGDHGGGPTREMLDQADRWQKPDVVYPKLRYSTATEFFKELEEKLPQLQVPVWKDELYFEYHRGAFTTQADTKQRVRQGEETLLNAEKFATLASLFATNDEGSSHYPADDLDRLWKDLLFEDFHDILPGSGIAVNYLDAKRTLQEVDRAGNEILSRSLRTTAEHIDTTAQPGVPVVVFNPLSWPRSEVIEAAAQLPEPARSVVATDARGRPVPSQLVSIDPQTHRARVLLLADTPSLGYSTYYLIGNAARTGGRRKPLVQARGTTLENGLVRVSIDPQTGCMTSLYNMRAGTEALAPAETDTGGPKDSVCGNLLQAFHDQPKEWDAWNIDADFEKQHWDLTQADEVKVTETGSLRAVIRVKKHFQNSTFTQDITLTAGSPRVDVVTTADWREKHVLLKAAFPLSSHNEKATFEIPYGSIERPTTRNTPAEQGKFEVPAIQWADISDTAHGLSLLNDSKYGYDAKGNVLRLSLLRSPEWPDPHADEGVHHFTYSVYPHPGGWKDALTVRQGYELNYKLVAMQVERHRGSLPASKSFITVQPENVVLTALKKAEDGGKDWIVRFYEWAGKEADVRIELPASPASASEADLMERPLKDLAVQSSSSVTIHTKPYEIKTVRLRMQTSN